MPLTTGPAAPGPRAGTGQAAGRTVPRPRLDAGDAPSAHGPSPDGPARRRLRIAGGGLGLLALTALLVRVSLSVGMDADAANKALQGWDLLHGHLFLHGWITGDATFYALESPVCALVESVIGLTPMVAHIEPALVYVLILVLAVLLGRGAASGWAAGLRAVSAAAVLLVPLASPYGVSLLMEQPDHVGTSAFLLGAFLLADRAGRGRGWIAPCGVLLVCTAGILSDDTVTYVAIPALVIVCGARLIAAWRLRGPDAGVLLAALASIPLEHEIRRVMHHFDGYWMTRPATEVADPGTWPVHAHRTLRAVGALFGLLYNASPVYAALGGCVFGAALAGFVRVLWLWRTASRAELCCALAIVLNLAVYTLSTAHTPIPAHEIAAVLPLGAVLAARSVSPAWAWWRTAARRLCVAIAAAALVPLAASALRPPQPPIPTAPQPALAGWLAQHGLHYGIAGYWDASTLTVDSGGAVAVRAVVRTHLGFAMYGWETREDWYLPSRHDATFAIAYDGPGTFGLIDSDKLGTADFEALLGKPAEIHRIDGRTVLVYPGNLLDHVSKWLPPRTRRE
jgi:hypothetical protein